jgi:hypothetical protein
MTEYFKWMEQHFELFFALCFLWVLAFVAFCAWRRLRAGPSRPPFSGSDGCSFFGEICIGLVGQEPVYPSGWCAECTSGDGFKDALLVEPVGIFKWLMPTGFNDLEHYVPRSDILRVETASTLGRNTVRIEIRGRDGTTRILDLAVRGHDELLSALRS